MEQNVTVRELLEEKIGSIKHDLYTFRKQVLGNGQPGDLDRIRGVIKDTGGKCDSRNSALWKAIDEIREEHRRDMDAVKQRVWQWSGGLAVVVAAAELLMWTVFR
jgi:hypothetical protein